MARNALTAVSAQERARTIPRLHRASTVAWGLVRWGKWVWIVVVHSVTRGWQDIRFLLGCMGYMATHTTSGGTRILPLCIEGRNIIGSKTYPRKRRGRGVKGLRLMRMESSLLGQPHIL